MTDCHASAVSLPAGAVVLLGASGCGKSDLAWRLIEAGGVLIGDDRLDIAIRDGQLFASPRENLAGLIEIRGVGLLKTAYRADVALNLAVRLVARKDVPRLPSPAFWSPTGDVEIPAIALHAFDATTPAKIRLALETLARTGFPDDAILHDA